MYLLSILFGSLIINIISRRLYKSSDFVSNLITLLLITFPIQLLAFTNAKYISTYFYLLIVCTIISFIYSSIKFFSYKNTISSLNINLNSKNFKNILFKLFSILFVCCLVYKIIPIYWRFESHDLLYFSWLNGIFDLNYTGPIRYPTASALEMSANHLTAGSVLIPFLSFLKINLYQSYTTKTIILILSISIFLDNVRKLISKQSNQNNFLNNLFFFFLTITLFFRFYSTEMYSMLSVSNYILLVLILGVGCECIYFRLNKLNKEKEFKNKFISRIFLLLFLLATAKAYNLPIFIFTIIFFYYFSFQDKDLKKIISLNLKNSFVIGSSLIILAVLGWTIQDSNHGTIDGSFPLCLISGIDINSCIGSIVVNPFANLFPSGSFKMQLLQNLSISNLIGFNELFNIWFYCLLPLFFLGRNLSNNSKSISFKIFGNIAKSYSLSTALAVAFFRGYGQSGSNSWNAFLIVPAFILICICFIYIENGLNRKINLYKIMILFLTIPILFLSKDDIDIQSRRTIALKNGPPERVSATIDELNSFNYDVESNIMCTANNLTKSKFKLFLDENYCAKGDLKEIYSAVNGLKNNVSLEAFKSQVYEFSLK